MIFSAGALLEVVSQNVIRLEFISRVNNIVLITNIIIYKKYIFSKPYFDKIPG